MKTEDNKDSVAEPQSPTNLESTQEVEKPSIRESLEKNLKADDKTENTKSINGTASEPAKGKSFVNNELVPSANDNPQNSATNAAGVTPPGDMNAEERAAFLNPTAQNIHVLQGYHARRAEQTNTTFQRRMAEVVTKEREYDGLSRVITQDIRDEYARERTSVPQLVENAIAWDRAFKTNKNATAVEYLKAQGVNLDEFVRGVSDGTLYEDPKPQYLTQEQADKLWEEKRQKEEEARVASESYSALESFLSNPAFQGDPSISEQRQLAVAREVRILKEVDGFQGSTQELLERALQRAVGSHEAFSGLQNQQAAKPTETSSAIHEQMQKVRDAKKASRTISGSLGSGSPVTKATSLRESLEQNYYKS